MTVAVAMRSGASYAHRYLDYMILPPNSDFQTLGLLAQQGACLPPPAPPCTALPIFGRMDLQIGVSGAKFDAEADLYV